MAVLAVMTRARYWLALGALIASVVVFTILFGTDVLSLIEALIFAVVAALLITVIAAVRADIGQPLQTLFSAIRFYLDLRPRGVERVFAGRLQAEPQILDMLVRQAERENGWMILMGISLREYFHPTKSRIFQRTPFRTRVAQALKSDNNSVHWDIVVLTSDPRCMETARRADHEQTEVTIAEIGTTIREYEHLYLSYRDRIRLWTYEKRPFVFAAITSHEGGFEQRYRSAPPWAPGTKYVGSDVAPPVADGDAGCYGDLYPVFRLKQGSDFYEMLLAELRDFIEKDCTLHTVTSATPAAAPPPPAHLLSGPAQHP